MKARGVRNLLYRIGLVPSVTTLFIWGLVFSYAFARNAVGDILMDFLKGNSKLGLRYAAVLVNLKDGVSALFQVVITHVTEDHQSGRFILITFCAASYPLGLLLISYIDALYPMIFATVLIAFGEAGRKILSDFYSYQLGEKIKNIPPENEREKEFMKELERIQFPLHVELTPDLPKRKTRVFITTRVGARKLKSKVINKGGKRILVTKIHEPRNLWSASAKITGIVTGVYFSGNNDWVTKFLVSSLVMVHAYLVFLCGIFWYYPEPEERPTGSPLTTIYRVLKEAFRKRGVAYPSSAEGYYSSNGNIEASNDSENPFYTTRENGSSNGKNEGPNDLEDPSGTREDDPEVHLKPRHPSFLLRLDKAAIKIEDNQIEERQEEICTMQQVRDVKSLFLILPLGLTFFAYSLVSASADTYFVEQATNLDSKVGHLNVPIVSFLVLQDLVACVVRFIQSRKQVVGPIRSMAVGIVCSVVCCISAGAVESNRLSMAIGIDPDKDVIPLSIMILTPQFVLQGLMKGFAEDGLRNFVQDRVPESMRKFVDPSIEMLLGIGKLSSIPCAFIFHWWIKDSINNSHLDRYFLMLAVLSLVFVGIYFCYAMFVLRKLPKFEGADANEEGNVQTMGQSEEVLKEEDEEEILEEKDEEVVEEDEEEIFFDVTDEDEEVVEEDEDEFFFDIIDEE